MKKLDRTEIIFATPIYVGDLKITKLNNQLINYCNKIKKQKGRSISNIGGWQSEDVDCSFPIINQFITNIEPALKKYANSFLENDKVNIKIDNLWFNINKKNHYNQEHAHDGGVSNCDFSAVYYLKTSNNERCGNLYFVNPDNLLGGRKMFFKYPINSYNPFNSARFNAIPKTQRLILFPSHLKHATAPNQTSSDRISLSFNWSIE
jgi:uncharacterized protein (TIGR02466 family)